MIVMELSLVSLGLVFVLTNRHQRATTFGLASLCFLVALFFGSLTIAAFGIAVMFLGSFQDWLSQSPARRAAAISLIVMLVLTATVIQNVDVRGERQPKQGDDVPKALFTNNAWSLPQSLQRFPSRTRLSGPIGQVVPTPHPEPTFESTSYSGRLSRLKNLSGESMGGLEGLARGFHSQAGADQKVQSEPVNVSDLRDVLNTVVSDKTLGVIHQFVQQNDIQFQAKSGDVFFSGLVGNGESKLSATRDNALAQPSWASPIMGAEQNRNGMSLRVSFDVLLMEWPGLSQTDAKRLN